MVAVGVEVTIEEALAEAAASVEAVSAEAAEDRSVAADQAAVGDSERRVQKLPKI